MLELEMIEQLKQIYTNLENTIELVYTESSHQDQNSLVEMLKDIESTSSKIKVVKDSDPNHKSDSPHFALSINGKKSGVSFLGIPTGHEFSSLVLAILNADGKGKLPDSGTMKRIKKLKGPIRVKTYISLTCENCPDVVQALNIMALNHPDFMHEMIDGAYVQADIDRLSIQGVPSVVTDSEMIHSGKTQFLDLLKKLEEKFGTTSSDEDSEPVDLGQFDVAVIGAGPAGASAAIYSVRKGLKTAIIAEKIGGQVQETRGIENLISIPYTEGPKLAANLAEHMSTYPIHKFENRRVKSLDKTNKLITFEGGEFLKADAIIIATGAKWRELNIPGEKEYLGRGVAFCPHCDGPFYKGKSIAVIGGGNSGVEAAIDLAGIVEHVTLFEFNDSLKADQVLVDKLKSLKNTKIITSAKTEQVIGNGQKVTAIEYTNRSNNEKIRLNLDGVFVQIGLIPNTSFLKDVVELSKFGEIKIDEKCRTNVPGIYAAGDVTTTPYKQIIIAMGEGAKASLAAFEDKMYHQSGK